ncbi:MAG: PQQ-binding-like beta-propeller repeat protein [Psychrobium sp.]|nr:PQQ-binding-like beta-propeller repeat protein [Psychrobium sp.]
MLKRILIIIVAIGLVSCTNQDTPKKIWRHAAGGVLAATISQDGSLALVSSSDHGMILWDLTNNEQKYRWQQNTKDIKFFTKTAPNLVLFTSISPNNKYALSADKDSFIVWSIETGRSLTYTKIKDSSIRDIVIANNGNILIGKVNGVVVHVDIFSGRRIEFLGHNEKINSVAMSPNGRYALTGGSDYVALFWDTKTAQVIHRFIHPTRITKVALDRNGKYAFSAGSQRLSAIWDLKTGKQVSKLQYLSRSLIFSAVTFSKDSTQLYTGNPGRILNRWDVATGDKLQQWKVTPREGTRPASSVILAIGEGKSGTLITESSSGFAEFWDYQR